VKLKVDEWREIAINWL